LGQLNEVLARERKQGCAWSFSGYEAGINACAAAVRSVSGSAVAAISVVGPERVFGENGAFAKRVEAAVKLAADELARIAAC
jgi:DNA-binding IclR family transcriptional regulator